MTKGPFITVRDLYEAKAKVLGLRLAGGVNGLDNQITVPRIQKLGLALAGYTDYLHSGRVQFLGRTEQNYLEGESQSAREDRMRKLFELKLSCIVVTTGLTPSQELVKLAREHRVPVLLTPVPSSRAIDDISEYLNEQLAPAVTVHGVMMEVYGLGIFIIGRSGIGKSECGLELVLRGHRLVSDDLVVLRRFGTDRLVGSGPSSLRFHMEVRGLGIINIRDLFGISSVATQKPVDLAVELILWDEQPEEDRISFEERSYQLLDSSIPLITLPVASGRNVATLVEVAVRLHLLKKQGYRPTVDFVTALEKQLRSVAQP